MKIISILFLGLLYAQLFACSKDKEVEPISNNNDTPSTDSMKLKITIGSNVFFAVLQNNATVEEFKKKLPITINMIELNGNEKYFDLSSSLPTKASNPGTIKTGDLMLYGSKTVVLFYKSFSTSYNYTKLGCINNPLGLEAALGIGNVNVIFELQQMFN